MFGALRFTLGTSLLKWLHRSANLFPDPKVGGVEISSCDARNYIFGTRAANVLMLRYDQVVVAFLVDRSSHL